MRLINREYSKRMKLKILETTSIDLSGVRSNGNNAFEINTFLYFLTFLKEQNLFDEGTIGFDSPFIYNHFEQIKLYIAGEGIPKKTIPQKCLSSNDDDEATVNGVNSIESPSLSETTSAPPKVNTRKFSELSSLNDEEIENEIFKLITLREEEGNEPTIVESPKRKVQKSSPTSLYGFHKESTSIQFKREIYSSSEPLELLENLPTKKLKNSLRFKNLQLLELIGKFLIIINA